MNAMLLQALLGLTLVCNLSGQDGYDMLLLDGQHIDSPLHELVTTLSTFAIHRTDKTLTRSAVPRSRKDQRFGDGGAVLG